MDGETVPDGFPARTEGLVLQQYAPFALSVEDGGILLEVAEREVVVGWLVAFKAAIDAVALRDVESAFGVGGVAVVGASLHPYLGATATREGCGKLELVGGVFPRRAIARTVGTDVDDAVFVGLDVHRHHVGHHRLALVETVHVGGGVVAVAAAAPTEVEVEAVAVVVAVANEGVAAVAVGTAVVHGMPLVEFCPQHGIPSLLVVCRLLAVFRAAVAEIGAHGGLHVARHGAAARSRIVHVDAHAAVVHQGGHGIVVAPHLVGHLVPMVGGGTEVGTLFAVLTVDVTM